MCGIAGLIGVGVGATSAPLLETMTGSIAHRGPDDSGHWYDDGAALGFRRLAILDLSPTGRQPMVSDDGDAIIVFNGEIYNFIELRDRLSSQGAHFRGRSDTEVLLKAYQTWGIEQTLAQIEGMFAAAVWTRSTRTLHIFRDRFGEKPLYYAHVDGCFAFASELKALRALPAFNREIDRQALSRYFTSGNVPAPFTIYRAARKLPPASLLTLTRGSQERISTYWSAAEAAHAGLSRPLRISDEDALTEMDRALSRSVRTRMIADVPLGAFLSGGVDSSLALALMKENSTAPVKTYTIGFDDQAYDESASARAVALALGADHHEHRVSARDALDLVPILSRVYDEPFADSSQIPTLLVSRFARRSVTVALTGDGGDEVFGGYNRHLWGPRLVRWLGWLPLEARAAAGKALASIPPRYWDAALRGRLRTPGDKMQKLSRLLSFRDGDDLYRILTTHWDQNDGIVLGENPAKDIAPLKPMPGYLSWLQTRDATDYLPNDILVKVDRASMSASLETRTPYLDHRLVELLWRMPERLRVRGGTTRWIQRQLLAQKLPRALFERPKMGFGIPLGSWLRGPLRDWCEALLDEGRLRREGFLNVPIVRKRWEEHLSGARSCEHLLWDCLMFQSWLESERGH